MKNTKLTTASAAPPRHQTRETLTSIIWYNNENGENCALIPTNPFLCKTPEV